MKARFSIWLPLAFLLVSTTVSAQALRTGSAVAGSSGATRSAGGVSQPGRAGFQSAPSFQSRGSGQIIIRNSAPLSRGAVLSIPPAAGAGRASSSTLKKAPERSHLHPSHVHPHFPKRSGILIIEVPTVVETTVTIRGQSGSGASGREPTPSRRTDFPGRGPKHLAPFDPTPQEVVERMLTLAGVKNGDVVYDLGSGDGRILIAAAKKFAVKGVGFEIDPGLVKLARENIRREKLEKLVEIREQDFMTADLSSATVVTLYLSFDGNLKVRPLLVRQLRPGTRVVSYHFDMGDWQPKIVESYRDSVGETHLLYYWEISGPFVLGENPR